jgi:N-acetylglucosamine kinase-like BadF-type ATPase
MRYFLGVDGGASKTHALLLDEGGQALGFGDAGCGNHQIHGLQAAVIEIEKAARGALSGARVKEVPIDVACFCLAGADLEEDYAMLQPAMEALNLARLVVVKNDTMAVMRSGLTQSWGVGVICGTGFNAAGRSKDGRELILPALGDISGDWGGGGTLSMEMIRLVMRAWDGRGKPTALTGLILKALKLPSVEELLRDLYHERISHEKLLGLVPLLFEAAEAGDEPSRELLIRMGAEVALTANTFIRRCNLEDEEVEVVLGGGVFKGKGSLLLDTVKQEIRSVYPQAKIIRPRFEPVVGAALLAMETLGYVVDVNIYARLEQTLPERLLIHENGNV